MYTHNYFKKITTKVGLVLMLASNSVVSDELVSGFNFGRPVSQSVSQEVSMDVRYDGVGLPEGAGSYEVGNSIYMEKCQNCHGVDLQGIAAAGTKPLIGPGKTISHHWPYAPTLFDYIRRAMPFPEPRSLTNDEVYSLVTYILAESEIISRDKVLDAKTLADIKMPNRNGFIFDNRPDVIAR